MAYVRLCLRLPGKINEACTECRNQRVPKQLPSHTWSNTSSGSPNGSWHFLHITEAVQCKAAHAAVVAASRGYCTSMWGHDNFCHTCGPRYVDQSADDICQLQTLMEVSIPGRIPCRLVKEHLSSPPSGVWRCQFVHADGHKILVVHRGKWHNDRHQNFGVEEGIEHFSLIGICGVCGAQDLQCWGFPGE